MRTGGSTLVPGIARSSGSTSAATATTLPVLYLYAVWAVTVFDLHFFLGNVVAAPLGKLGTAVYVPLLLILAVQGPRTPARHDEIGLLETDLELAICASYLFGLNL